MAKNIVYTILNGGVVRTEVRYGTWQKKGSVLRLRYEYGYGSFLLRMLRARLNSSYISTLLKRSVRIVYHRLSQVLLASVFPVPSFIVCPLSLSADCLSSPIRVSLACFSYLPWRYRISPSFESNSAVEDGVLQLLEAENSLLLASGKELHPDFSLLV